MFLVLSCVAMDIISVQSSSVASKSTFSTSGRVLSIQRTRLTLASLGMCMCLKDHLDAIERKQDKCPLEIPLDFEQDVFDDEVQRNEVFLLFDEEIPLDASSEGTLSPGGPGSAIHHIYQVTELLEEVMTPSTLYSVNFSSVERKMPPATLLDNEAIYDFDVLILIIFLEAKSGTFILDYVVK
nr:putative AC transposase [Tanacetum cinerariifolium]